MPITFRPQGPVGAKASIRDGLTWGQCFLAGVGAPWRPGGRTLWISGLSPLAGRWLAVGRLAAISLFIL
ncbi:MAG: hypothetical protein JWQ16_3486 [Novosphingobium sp.]|nr:hypothetical protein [Novosphingobium sp.]